VKEKITEARGEFNKIIDFSLVGPQPGAGWSVVPRSSQHGRSCGPPLKKKNKKKEKKREKKRKKGVKSGFASRRKRGQVWFCIMRRSIL